MSSGVVQPAKESQTVALLHHSVSDLINHWNAVCAPQVRSRNHLLIISIVRSLLQSTYLSSTVLNGCGDTRNQE